MSMESEAMTGTPQRGNSGEKAPTTSRAADAAHGVIDDTAARAEVMEQRIRRQAKNASEKVEASQEAAARQLETTVEKAQAFAKEQPVAAAGIAFAAGVLATALLRR